MQRAPANGGQVGLAAAVDPTTAERLEHVGTLLAQKKPWPAFLHLGARAIEEWEACPSPVQEALAWMATSAVGVLDIASIGPLEPVCQAFKALIEAAEGAAASQEKLQSLVSRCAFLTTVLIQHGRAVGPLAQVQKPIEDFVVMTNKLAVFAAKWAKGGKCRAFFCHRIDLSTVTDFEEGLRSISNDIDLVDGLEHHQQLIALRRELLPPSLPDMAAVPAGALTLPQSYVERAAVQEVADGLIKPEEPRAPYAVVGMGGGGKTMLVSAVVRKSNVREHFRGGVFWMRVGRHAKNSLLSLLQGLAKEMSAAPTDTPHGVPHVLESLEQVKQHLATVASAGTSPRLVVLDDVWEREVVDALLSLGLKVLVTTRDRSVVGVSGGLLELGDMMEEEALELLLKTSRTVGQPGHEVRTQMTKVVALCGHLPLVLAIAGSMSVVKGKGLTAVAWEELIQEFENVAKKMRVRGEQSSSIKVVLGTSFDALAVRKQEESLKMAVLAAGALAPIEMLRNLWEIEDAEGTREEAEGLVSKCLLQAVGGSGYRVHDLVLEFVKTSIRAEEEMVEKATALQAQYLGRVDVLKSYGDPEHGAGNQGLFFLDALWRSVEKLSGDPELEVASYRASLGELESCEATEDVASSYGWVGFLFSIQGKFTEAEPLYGRSQAIQEKVLGPEHPDVATSLNNRALLLEAQGKYVEAEPLCERSQAIREKVLGPEHLDVAQSDVAQSLNNRAGLLYQQGKYDEADPLYVRVLQILAATVGEKHPNYASTLNNRAALLETQGKYDEAGPLYDRSHTIREKSLGPDHPAVAESLNNRAGLLMSQCSTTGRPNVATALINRAELLRAQGKYAEAEPLYERATEIWETALGPDHPTVAVALNNRAALLESQGKYAEAEPLYERSQAIREKVLGPEHPDVAQSLNNRAGLGKYSEAEPLYERCQAIEEKALGPEHPSLATTLNNRAGLLYKQGKLSEAEPLFKRTQEIFEKSLGQDHPNVATILSNRAWLLNSQEKYTEAIPLFERALLICTDKLGGNHPDTVSTRNSLEIVRKKV